MKSIYNSKQNVGNKAAGIAMICGLLLAVGIISYGLVSLGLMPCHLEWFCIIIYLIVAVCVSVCLYITTSEKIIFCRAFRTDLSSREIKEELSLYLNGVFEVIGLLLCALLVGLVMKFLSVDIILIFIATYLMGFTYMRYYLINRNLNRFKEKYPTTYKKNSLI